MQFVCRQLLLLPPGNKAKKETRCLTVKPGIIQLLLRIMKLTAVLLLVVSMQLTAASYEQKITLSVKNVPLEKVFKEVELQTGYKFLYTSQLLAAKPKVSITVKEASVKEVLDLVLKSQKLEYEIIGRTIVIRPKLKSDLPNLVRGKKLLIDENRIDSGINISVKSTAKGTTISIKGEFVLINKTKSCVTLMSALAYGKNRKSLAHKKGHAIRQISVIKNLDQMQVLAEENNSPLFPILQGKIPAIKIVVLASLNIKSAIVWVRKENSVSENVQSLKKKV